MQTEVKRNNWTRYLRKFNEANRFRPATVHVQRRGQKSGEWQTNSPLLGLVLTRKGRVIDGMSLYTAGWNPEQLTQPVVAVNQLKKIVQEKDSDGTVRQLTLEADDGSRLTVEFTGPAEAACPRDVVERLAYAVYERRGAGHGRDFDDWLEAEQVIRRVERDLVG